jgi:hypothetical protein
MKKFFLLFCLSLLAVQTIFSQSAAGVLTNKSIVDLHKAGISDDVIITSINGTACKFDVSPAGMIALKKQQLSDELIKAMVNKTNGVTAAPANTPPVAMAKTSTPPPAAKQTGINIDLLNYVHVMINNQPKPLEKSTAGMRTKQGMFGGSAMWQIEGPASSVRLGLSDNATFLINTGGSTLPEMVLYRVKSAKGRREVAAMKVNSFSGVKTGEDVIPVDITKLREGIYQLTPNKKLEKGEYFFAGKAPSSSASMEAFAFGID